MKPRKLRLADGVWRWVVSGVRTFVWSPSGKKVALMNWWVSGAPKGQHVCNDWHGCSGSGNPVTPGLLRAFIEQHKDHFSRSSDVEFFF